MKRRRIRDSVVLCLILTVSVFMAQSHAGMLGDL